MRTESDHANHSDDWRSSYSFIYLFCFIFGSHTKSLASWVLKIDQGRTLSYTLLSDSIEVSIDACCRKILSRLKCIATSNNRHRVAELIQLEGVSECLRTTVWNSSRVLYLGTSILNPYCSVDLAHENARNRVLYRYILSLLVKYYV